MDKLTTEWVAKAEEDLGVVKRIRKAKPPLHDATCFHCQQAAEKYLKALLQELGLSVPHTHDLPDLLERLLPHTKGLKSLGRSLTSLTHYAVDYRYPGIRATTRQAEAAWRHALQTRTAIRKQLGI
jgi:HEPN domain-containing protein